eukprot:TRINITY_DN311_c0_g1_i1.p1 TRINITY_DN311_c0_g1~~TRINITY_DN311_c0_g1_i1.p1  ORF type:complete len:185 (-),score=38.04 TRINITY_DN311_c0_g1_i1:168-722(-)
MQGGLGIFPDDCRVHISITVSNIEASIKFYKTLFGKDPIIDKWDYASFAVDRPPAIFTLHKGMPGKGDKQPSNFSIQLKDTMQVTMAKQRLILAGISASEESGVSCDYVVQDRVIIIDPDNNRWVIFAVQEREGASSYSIPLTPFYMMNKIMVNNKAMFSSTTPAEMFPEDTSASQDMSVSSYI